MPKQLNEHYQYCKISIEVSILTHMNAFTSIHFTLFIQLLNLCVGERIAGVSIIHQAYITAAVIFLHHTTLTLFPLT